MDKINFCIQCHVNEALPPEHEHGRFCSAACHQLWADRTYGVKSSSGRKTVAEMRQQLGEMAKQAHLKNFKGEQQKLL